jgi:hypothetical protein
MSFDGGAERQAITDRLKALCGGRVTGPLPDDAVLEPDADGNFEPYIVVRFGQPIPTAHGRSIGLSERGQPHIMPITASGYAMDADTAGRVGTGISRLLVGWQPTEENSTEMKASGGYNYAQTNTRNKPTRFEEARYFTTVVNMLLDDLEPPTV